MLFTCEGSHITAKAPSSPEQPVHSDLQGRVLVTSMNVVLFAVVSSKVSDQPGDTQPRAVLRPPVASTDVTP